MSFTLYVVEMQGELYVSETDQRTEEAIKNVVYLEYHSGTRLIWWKTFTGPGADALQGLCRMTDFAFGLKKILSEIAQVGAKKGLRSKRRKKK